MKKQILLSSLIVMALGSTSAQAYESTKTIKGVAGFSEAETDLGRCTLAQFRAAEKAQKFCNQKGQVVDMFDGGYCLHELPFPWVRWQVIAKYAVTCK